MTPPQRHLSSGMSQRITSLHMVDFVTLVHNVCQIGLMVRVSSFPMAGAM